MQQEEQNDSTQNNDNVNYSQQGDNQPVVPPVSPANEFTQPQPQPQLQQFQPYNSNNLTPTPPAKKKFNLKMIAIVAAIILILSVGVFVLLSSLNKDSSKTDTTSGNSSNTVSGEDNSGGTKTDAIAMVTDKQRKTFSSAFFSMKYPDAWGEFQRFQNASIFGPSSERITKDINGGEEMPLYYMAVSDMLELDPPKYAGWTFNDAWIRADEKITEGAFSPYSGETLIGTETSKKEVTVGGVDYTKIVGKTTDGYMQANYIAYIGFYTNENRHASRVPIAIVMFIASDDATDIAYGETILDACMATIEPRK